MIKAAVLTLSMATFSLTSLLGAAQEHGHMPGNKHIPVTKTIHIPAMKTMKAEAPTKLIAVFEPTAGNITEGVVTFEKVKDGIMVSGKITGLTPGEHGFHVHQYGDLTADDGTSTGGHFNPMTQPHAGPEDAHRHIGDLGNVTANEDGVAEFSFIDKKLEMNGTASIIGRGLIVHADRDDLTSQPTGAAGARVGMAVIGIAKASE